MGTGVMEATQTPLQAAMELVDTERQIKQAKERLSNLNSRKSELQHIIEDAMERGDFQESSKVNGASVFHRSTVRAKIKSHDSLVSVLEELGMTEYLPKTVNANSISGYVRERLKLADVDATASLAERIAASDLDPRLIAVLEINEYGEVVVNGA